MRCRHCRKDCPVHLQNETPGALCTGHIKCLFGTMSQQNPNQVVLNKLLIACIGPRGQTISWYHVMPVKSALTVILLLGWTYMVPRTWGKGGRGWRHHRERGDINVWGAPLPWQHYCDVWLSLVFLAPGAHQMEPPSPTQALGVNPFPSRFINRMVPWEDLAC